MEGTFRDSYYGSDVLTESLMGGVLIVNVKDENRHSDVDGCFLAGFLPSSWNLSRVS